MPFHGNTVIAGDSQTAGIKATFATAYKKSAGPVLNRLRSCMDLGMPSDKLTEIYAYPESAPHPVRWPRGQRVPMKSFEYEQFQVTNYDWAINVPWHLNDEEDDLTKTLPTQARMAGTNFATLHERVFFQILTGTADPDLLPAIPNAPDGLAITSTSTRFGRSGGNTVTGTGVATTAQIVADVFSAIEAMIAFQDTEGQPLWDASVFMEGFTIVYGAENSEIFGAAFLNAFHGNIVANQAGSENVGGNTSSNTLLSSGYKFNLWGTPRLTGADYYVFANGVPFKPIFQQERRGLRYSDYTMANSDNARLTKEVAAQWDARYGYGVFLPYGLVKVDNS